MDWGVKTLLALWRAKVYLVLAGTLAVIHTVYRPLFVDVPPGQRIWYQDLADKALGSLDKLAYLILIAGLAYVVLAEISDHLWTGKVQADVREGFDKIATT